jgi:glycerol transport system permease protein
MTDTRDTVVQRAEAAGPTPAVAMRERAGLRRAKRNGPRVSWLVPTLYIVFLMLPIYWLMNMSFKTNTEIT